VLRKADIQRRSYGKGELRSAVNIPRAVMAAGVRKFLTSAAPKCCGPYPRAKRSTMSAHQIKARPMWCGTNRPALHRLPERPIFAAMKLVEKGPRGPLTSRPISAAICSRSCRRSYRGDDDGLWPRPGLASAFNVKADKRSIAIMGDGGFLAHGLTSGIGNAVYNQHERRHPGGAIIIRRHRRPGPPVVARRQQNRARPSTDQPSRERIGAKWVRQIDRTYTSPKCATR